MSFLLFYEVLLGSSRPLKVSPTKLNAILTMKIVRPGKVGYHQYPIRYFLLMVMMAPHSGVGGSAPKPMKLSPHKSKIAMLISNVVLTGPLFFPSLRPMRFAAASILT
jgi:hypothetical protein